MGWVVVLIAACASLCLADGEAIASAVPSVTRKESALLEQVRTLSETDARAAIELFDEVDLAAASAAVDFTLGNLFLKTDQLDKAGAAYRAALVKVPGFDLASANLGRVLLLQNKPKDAARVFGGLLQRTPTDGDILLLLGHSLLMGGRTVSAENAYRQALLYDSESEDALLGLAKCLLLQERHAEGIKLLEELLDADPSRGELWSLRANALIAMDELTRARVTLEAARRLGVSDGEMLSTLGDLYLNAEQPDDAVVCYQEAMGTELPVAKRMLHAVEGLLALGRIVDAASLLDDIDAIRKKHAGVFNAEEELDLLRLKGKLAQLRADDAAAQEIYDALLAKDPTDGKTLILLGDLRVRQEKYDEAVMHYGRAARINGHEVVALVKQAQVEVQRLQYRRAIELLEAAQTFQDQSHVARYLEQVRRLDAQSQ